MSSTKKVRLYRLREGTLDILEQTAKAERRTLSETIESAIVHYAEKHKKEV